MAFVLESNANYESKHLLTHINLMRFLNKTCLTSALFHRLNLMLVILALPGEFAIAAIYLHVGTLSYGDIFSCYVVLLPYSYKRYTAVRCEAAAAW